MFQNNWKYNESQIAAIIFCTLFSILQRYYNFVEWGNTAETYKIQGRKKEGQCRK